VRDAIDNREIPGAVVWVEHDGQVIYKKAIGNRALDPKSAEDLLAERYVRGEIDADEYGQRVALLRERPTSSGS